MLSPKNSPTYIEKERLEQEKPASEQKSSKATDDTKVEERAEKNMDIYTCSICGYQYDPEEGEPGSGFRREYHLQICPMTINALYAMQAKYFKTKLLILMYFIFILLQISQNRLYDIYHH